MLKIGWLFVGNKDTGSTRIGGLNIHYQLLKDNVQSYIINLNKKYAIDPDTDVSILKQSTINLDITHIVIQKLCGQKTIELTKFCKNNNIKVIYINVDWFDTDMYVLSDIVIVGSKYLKELVLSKYKCDKIYVLDDALEYSDNLPLKEHIEKEPVFGWFGNFMKLEYFKYFCNKLGILRTFTISNTPVNFKHTVDYVMGDGTNISWNTLKVIDLLIQNVDIVILPVEITETIKHNVFSKTSNRLILPMSLGIPTISSQVPSYVDIIKNDINGYICDSDQEWKKAINSLTYKGIRKKIGYYSYLEIKNKYSIYNIAKEFLKCIGY